MRRGGLKTLGLAALLVAVYGAPQAGAAEDATVSVGYRDGGRGTMIANSTTNPEDETWTWKACNRRFSGCIRFAGGRSVRTHRTPPGTVFRAVSSYGAIAVSPRWRGRLISSDRPSARGVIQANELATPVSGEWKGGLGR